jgi:exonuclease VII small subunit
VAYERGAALKARCDELLKNARLKVEEIYQTKEGGVDVKPSDLQALVDGPQ